MAVAMAMVIHSLAAQVTSWTSSDGKVIQAEFVRLDGEALVISKDGQELTVPVARLGQASRDQALKFAADRAWTSSDGKVIQAEFVRLDGEALVIKKDGKELRIPMTKLGQASREQARRFAAEKPVADATKGMPFENSLGMQFVPVPVRAGPSKALRVLFSVWETRRQDYAAYANTNPSVNGEWKAPKFPGGAGAAHKDNHPAVCVSMLDAVGFCKWLTDLERKAGKIGMNDTYRLPTDAEWSYAVGIGDKEYAEESPKAKDCKIADVYPWGTTWPRPDRVGNYSEVPLSTASRRQHLSGAFPRTI